MLDHSPNTSKALAHLHNVDIIVYCEGQEDWSFWKKLFTQYYYTKKLQYKKANGSLNLKPYIDSIINDNNQSLIVAKDRDYEPIIDHHNILYTYGYAIENCLFSEKNVELYIESIDFSSVIYWDELFDDKIIDLKNKVIKKIKQFFHKLDVYSIWLVDKAKKESSEKRTSIFMKGQNTQDIYDEIMRTDINTDKGSVYYDIPCKFIKPIVSTAIKKIIPIKGLSFDEIHRNMLIHFDNRLKECKSDQIEYYRKQFARLPNNKISIN
jgi:hypothetical protein